MPGRGGLPGLGRSRVTERLFRSTTVVRNSTDRTVQPASAAPSRTRFVSFDVRLTNMAIFSLSPMIVPTRTSGGFSGTGGGGGGGGAIAFTGAGAAATTGGGGRRDGLKSGRSRVAESLRIGIAQSGLPLRAAGGGAAPRGGAAASG